MILVTGAAGFIGAHVAARLASTGADVVGVDNFDDGYDVALKEARAAALLAPWAVPVLRVDCADGDALDDVFKSHGVTHVVHLAGRANVRDSMLRPALFTRANVTAFGNVLDCCSRTRVRHLVHASSSSVYGASDRPSAEGDALPEPASLYAATKRDNENAAQAYSTRYGLPATGLRLFTVYGPWGRPDMAPLMFIWALARGEPVTLFNQGALLRDFVFIDDAVDAICAALWRPPAGDINCAPYKLLNVGHPPAVPVWDFLRLLEQAMGRMATVLLRELPAGDVESTWSDSRAREAWLGVRPGTPLADGVARLVDWYSAYDRD